MGSRRQPPSQLEKEMKTDLDRLLEIREGFRLTMEAVKKGDVAEAEKILLTTRKLLTQPFARLSGIVGKLAGGAFL